MNNPSLSKSLVYYVTNCNYLDAKTKKVKLIDLHKIKEIYNSYVEIVKKNGLEMHDGIINEDYIYSDDGCDNEEKSGYQSSEDDEQEEEADKYGNSKPDKKDKDPSDDEGDNEGNDNSILDLVNNYIRNKNKNNKSAKLK